ncbi:MAG: hypothetical protein MI748_01900 [Opitutales bacterium]|nr:hypothetical protein [Opitutales bacterium]
MITPQASPTILLFFVAHIALTFVSSAERYVLLEGGGNLHTSGCAAPDLTQACDNLHDALSIAQPGDIIHIGPGQFNESNLEIPVNNLSIIGGFDTTTKKTILKVLENTLLKGNATNFVIRDLIIQGERWQNGTHSI